MGRRFAVAIVCLLAASVLGAQDAKPSEAIGDPNLRTVNPIHTYASKHPAPYTDVEALRIENVRLEGQIVQRAIADWQAKVKALKADLERVRPGFTFNPETGEWAAVTPPKEK